MSSRSGGSRQMDQRQAAATQFAPTPKPMSATQRKTLATKQLVSTVGPNQNAAVTAALEVVNERLVWDTALQQRISEKYGELTAPRSTVRSSRPSGPAPKPVTSGDRPAGIRTVEKLDPYRVLADFGRDRLRAVLERDTQQRLRTAVDAVQERNPGTKPATRTKKDDMVDYIVEHVAGPGC